MKIKLIVVSAILIISSLGAINVMAGTTQDQKDKVDLGNIAKQYLDFRETFHTIPSDKVEQAVVDDLTVQQIINGKTTQLNNLAKEGSTFYNKQKDLIKSAIESQKSATKSSINSQKASDNIENIRSFGGSVNDLKVSSITLNGNSAQVDLSYVSKATFGQWQKDHWVKVNPSNTINEHLVITRESASGRWNISDEKWDFAPGSEP